MDPTPLSHFGARPTRPPGVTTRVRAQARARELALCAGRLPVQVSQADYEQAKRELTGETDPDRQDLLLDQTLEPSPVPQRLAPESIETGASAPRRLGATLIPSGEFCLFPA
jgi:hypothetical protein